MKTFIFLVFFVVLHNVNSQGLINPLKKHLNKGAESSNGAVHVKISEAGLNYAASIAADIMVDEVSNKKIDDISGKKKVRYWVKNIKINSFRKPTPKISMIPGHGIKLRFENSALQASGRWRWKKGFVSDSGSVRAWVDAINIELSVNIVADSSGKPNIKAHSCNAHLGGFNVKLSGGASFIYNLIFKAFKGKVRTTLEKNICSGALDAINKNGNRKLSTLNLIAKVGNDLVLDYHLTGTPTFSGNHFETSHRGVFLGDPQKPQIPLVGTALTGMVGFSIAAEALNSAGRVLFIKNKLEKEFNVPAIKKLLEKLDSKFKDSEVLVRVSPKEAPRLTISVNKLTIHLHASAELVAKLPDGSFFSALTVDLKLEASARAMLVGESLVIQLIKITPEASIKINNIGEVPSSFLNSVLQEAIKIALPHINVKLMKGFPLLNVEKVKFPNASIKLLDGYMSVAADVKYQP